MKTVRFTGYKVSSAIHLKKMAAFFRPSVVEGWEDVIILGEEQLAEVYKYKMPNKKIYIFEFGCVVFENFYADEMNKFLEYLYSIIKGMDYKMLVKYTESHVIKVLEDQAVELWNGKLRTFSVIDDLAGIVANVLAKSVALSKIEADVNQLLDKAEGFIKNLQRGSISTRTKQYAHTKAQILRFEFESAIGIRIFDRPSETSKDLSLRETYDDLASYYELEDRCDVLKKKTNELRNIVRTYSTLRFKKQENRLLLFEIFLLALFPMSYLMRDPLRQNVIELVRKIFVN